jgi:hypothetical protein
VTSFTKVAASMSMALGSLRDCRCCGLPSPLVGDSDGCSRTHLHRGPGWLQQVVVSAIRVSLRVTLALGRWSYTVKGGSNSKARWCGGQNVLLMQVDEVGLLVRFQAGVIQPFYHPFTT